MQNFMEYGIIFGFPMSAKERITIFRFWFIENRMRWIPVRGIEYFADLPDSYRDYFILRKKSKCTPRHYWIWTQIASSQRLLQRGIFIMIQYKEYTFFARVLTLSAPLQFVSTGIAVFTRPSPCFIPTFSTWF